jgi:hypothetical protein
MQEHGSRDNINKDGVLQRSAEAVPEKEKGKLARNRAKPAEGDTEESGPGADPEIARAMGKSRKKR